MRLPCIVRELSSLQIGQKLIDERLESNRLSDSNGRSWYFSRACRIVDQAMPADTFAVYYSGYVFNGQTRPFGLVMISSEDPTDSIGREIKDRYASGLHIKIDEFLDSDNGGSNQQ